MQYNSSMRQHNIHYFYLWPFNLQNSITNINIINIIIIAVRLLLPGSLKQN